MIQEDYCSFEVAELLREKGFDESIFEFYIGNKDTIRYARNKHGFKLSELDGNFYYPHITHQTAIKWLREVHKLFIEVSIRIDLNCKYHFSYTILDKECKYIIKGYTSFDWNYENAVEAALKYCLKNLI